MPNIHKMAEMGFYKQAHSVIPSVPDAAQLFSLRPDRIGDIFVLADKETFFGVLDVAYEKVLRSYGSQHESCVPIIGYNSPFSVSEFTYNPDIGRLIMDNLHK